MEQIQELILQCTQQSLLKSFPSLNKSETVLHTLEVIFAVLDSFSTEIRHKKKHFKFTAQKNRSRPSKQRVANNETHIINYFLQHLRLNKLHQWCNVMRYDFSPVLMCLQWFLLVLKLNKHVSALSCVLYHRPMACSVLMFLLKVTENVTMRKCRLLLKTYK